MRENTVNITEVLLAIFIVLKLTKVCFYTTIMP